MKSNPDSLEFIEAVNALEEGQILEVEDGELTLEHRFFEPTHFDFHQRIFEPGVILKKTDSNIRIYISAEELGVAIPTEDNEYYFDKQENKDGTFKEASRGIIRNKVE